MTSEIRKLSIVVAARNDTHGGDFLGRMQVFVTGLGQQAIRHQLNCELIVVEWNPPTDRPRLVEAIRWPSNNGPMSVRIIEVPNELHKRLRYSDKLPLFQMIAKNVGIRRARAPFILATNVDILFSDELIEFLASGELKPRRMYRIDRYDVSSDIPVNATIEEQLNFCKSHVIRVLTKYGTFQENKIPKEEPRLVLAIPIELYALIPHIWHFLSFLFARLSLQPQEAVEQSPSAISAGVKAAHLLSSLRRHFRFLYSPLHLQAPGDFSLLSKTDWFAMRGYAEFEVHAAHIDSLLSVTAHRNGIVEEVLEDPMRIYHIEHSEGFVSAWQYEDLARRAGISMIDVPQFKSMVTKLYSEKRSILFNNEDWGFGSVSLPERDVYES